MKAFSAHITGFYRSSFHAYTTEVNVDGHRWRLGLRYSRFHEFYDQLVDMEKDFHAEFPPKGTLFFTPKPEERQEQLEVFLQQVLVYYAAKGYPTEIEDLLCDLLKVPRHLKSPEHEDDNVSTSTESVLDEPMHEPPSSSDSVASVKKVVQKEEHKPQVAENKMTKQDPVQEAVPEFPVAKEKIVAAPEPVQPACPVAENPYPVDETILHEEAAAKVEIPVPASVEETEAADVVKEEVATVEKEPVQEEETQPIVAQVPAEEPIIEAKAEKATKEEAVAADKAATEPHPEEPEVSSPDEQPVLEPVAQVSAVSEPQAAEKPAASESTSPENSGEQKELATSGRVASWLAAYLPKSLLGFIRRRCLKKTNLVVLCVALLLPMVLARR